MGEQYEQQMGGRVSRAEPRQRADADFRKRSGLRRLRADADGGAGPVRYANPRVLSVYAVCRYAERNALRAWLLEQTEQWRWSSLWRWKYGTAEEKAFLSAWPLPRPRDWTRQVNEPQTEAKLEAIRRCLQRGQPFGDQRWTERIVRRLSLEATIRPRGRPRKARKGS